MPSLYPEKPPEIWAEGRLMWEKGACDAVVADHVGVTRHTVMHRRKREGWARLPGEKQTIRLALVKETQNQLDGLARKRLVANENWADKRMAAADRFGETALELITTIQKAAKSGDEKLLKSAAVGLAILVDKAQLLSGGNTQRFAHSDVMHRAETVLDELVARRSS